MLKSVLRRGESRISEKWHWSEMSPGLRREHDFMKIANSRKDSPPRTRKNDSVDALGDAGTCATLGREHDFRKGPVNET